MTRARDLSRLGNTDVLAVDSVNQRVGVGLTTPDHPLHVVGVLSATSFVGDGSGLTNTISGVGINSGGTNIGYGVTTLNFIGNETTVEVSGTTANITPGGGSGITSTYQYSYQIDNSGQPATVGYGTERQLQSRLEDFVSVKDFGAVAPAAGSGFGDTYKDINTTAFQNAIETGKKVYVPSGVYFLNDTLSFSGQDVTLVGDGERTTQLWFKNVGDGISADITSGYQLKIEGLMITNSGSGGTPGTAIKVFTSDLIGEVYNYVVVNNVQINADWTKSLEIENCSQIKVNNLVAFQNNGTEIIHLKTNCMDSSFENMHIGCGVTGSANNVTGMLIDGHGGVPETGNEGIRVTNSTFLKTKIGINFDGTAGQYEPHLAVGDSHFNCQVNGIILKNAGCAYIHDNLFFAWTASDADEIVASEIIKVTGDRGGEESVIHSNTFSAAGRKAIKDVQDVGILWDSKLTYKPDYDGNQVSGQRPVLIHSNVFTDLDQCIKTSADVDFITCMNNIFNTNLNGSKQYVTTGNSNITDSTLLTNVSTGAVTQIIRSKGVTNRAVELRLQCNSNNFFIKQNSGGGAELYFEDALQFFTDNGSPLEAFQIANNGTGIYFKEFQVRDNFYLKSPNGSLFHIKVSDSGQLSATDTGQNV